jgi:hypothetical protein
MCGHCSQGVALGWLNDAPLVLKNLGVALGWLSDASLVLKDLSVALGCLSDAPLVLKNLSVAPGCLNTAPLVILRRITNVESIPHIPFIKCDIVPNKECPVFFLEGFCAVVFALLGNVLADCFHIGFGNSEGPVAGLPGKCREFHSLSFDPFGGGFFDVFDDLTDGNCSSHVEKEMDVIFQRVDENGSAMKVLQNGSHVGMQ